MKTDPLKKEIKALIKGITEMKVSQADFDKSASDFQKMLSEIDKEKKERARLREFTDPNKKSDYWNIANDRGGVRFYGLQPEKRYRLELFE